jgi:D-3-phosphoglycerate dehydrogenase
MKPEAILINTARGPVIDEAALVRALEEGWIAAVGLDVLETEPMAFDNSLRRLDNVVLTPHIGSYSDMYVENSWHDSVRTLVNIAQGSAPLWCVNPHAASSAILRARWARRTEPSDGKSMNVA